jgi:2-polyprenyl-3-methyl-5-hydroxy-6-metoxy-1,4-benzoquinol methylase
VNSSPEGTTERWPGDLETLGACPACGHPRSDKECEGLRDTSYGSASGVWTLWRCQRCRALYLNPRPDRASIHLAYRDYFTHAPVPDGERGSLSRIKHALANGYRNRVFRTSFKPALSIGALLVPLFPALADHLRREDRGVGKVQAASKRLLDVGCGNGHFLRVARRLGWLSYGVEMDEAAAAAARLRGGEILGAGLADLGPDFDEFFDVVTLSHVIEHLHDPVEALRHCWRILRPGGYIWLETPNVDAAGYGAYGKHWRGLEPPRHLVLFNTDALFACLERTAFEGLRLLPSRDVGDRLFLLSAASRFGLIAEREVESLPRKKRREARRVAVRAHRTAQREPGKAEFIAMVGYRPRRSA